MTLSAQVVPYGMVARKQRIPLVLDTNVFVRAFKSRSRRTANQRLVRLWLLEKRTQLIVCDELIDEYLGVFEKLLGMDDELIGGNKGEKKGEKGGRSSFPGTATEKSCVPLFLSIRLRHIFYVIECLKM